MRSLMCLTAAVVVGSSLSASQADPLRLREPQAIKKRAELQVQMLDAKVLKLEQEAEVLRRQGAAEAESLKSGAHGGTSAKSLPDLLTDLKQNQSALRELLNHRRAAATQPADMPRGSVPREFNGITYYIVPLR